MVKNVVGAPIEVVAECRLRHQLRKLADQAWQEVLAKCDKPFSPAYADGFRDGFVDTIDRNGSGEPHAVPPPRYRYPSLRTPQQQQEIMDWFEGFRHGARVSQEQRWREGIIVPIARPPQAPSTGFRQEIIATPIAPPDAQPDALPILPPPRSTPVAEDRPLLGSPISERTHRETTRFPCFFAD
jgi:hypothetical protein